MPPTSSADVDEQAAVLDQLALLALTYEIDHWNNKFPEVSEKHLSDADQNFLSECYVAYLIPTARGSVWWSGNNAEIARTMLLFERYPLVKNKGWKRNRGKTRNILRAWRKDAARIFPELTEDGYGDYDSDEDEDAWKNLRSKKRKGDETQHDARNNYKKPTVSRSDSSEVQEAPTAASTPSRSQIRAPSSDLITPPQSNEGTPAAVGDSDSEDCEPIPMRRRRPRPPSTPKSTPPGSAAAAAAYPSPLGISPTRTMASIALAAAPRHRGENCTVAFEYALDFMSRVRNENEKESDRRIAELGKSVKKLTEMVMKLTEQMSG